MVGHWALNPSMGVRTSPPEPEGNARKEIL